MDKKKLLEEHLLWLYDTTMSDDFAHEVKIPFNYNFVLTDDNNTLILNRNRISYSKKVGGSKGLNFCNKWEDNVEKYDLWLLEKIDKILQLMKISHIGITYNESWICDTHYYYYIHNKWKLYI